MSKLFLTTALLGFCLSATSSFAQDADDDGKSCIKSGTSLELDDEKKCLKSSDLLGQLELSTPNNALFTLLNTTPENVIKPEPGEPLSFSLLPQAVNALQDNSYAFAIEVNPGMFLYPEEFSMKDIQGTSKTPEAKQIKNANLLSMFSLSAMASSSTEGVDKTLYGVGANFTYDASSPMRIQGKFGDCVSKELNKKFSPTKRAELHKLMLGKAQALLNAGVTREQARKQAHQEMLKTNKEYAALNAGYSDATVTESCIKEVAPWNRTLIGAGAAFYDQEIKMDMVSEDQTGAGVWLSGSFSPNKLLGKEEFGNSLLTFSARYTDDLLREREENVETVDGWTAGARFTHQFSPKQTGPFRGFVEAAYHEEEFSTITDEFSQAGIGLEIKFSEALFFQATIGDTFGSEINRGKYMSGQFKWAFSKKAAK